MSKAQWIWFNGDFELYHSLKLHSRREEFGCDVPAFWHLSTPYNNCSFGKAYVSSSDDTVKVVTPNKAYVVIDGQRYPANREIPVKAGEHTVRVVAFAVDGFPCIYVNSQYLITDETWVADHMAEGPVPVGTSPLYDSETSNPYEFAFSYRNFKPVAAYKTETGYLYDFGREMFGLIRIENVNPETTVDIVYGESREEATDPANALIFETLKGKSSYKLVGRAFRWVSLSFDTDEKPDVSADYEYLDLEDRAYFSCNRKQVKKIWDVCAYTLHLNSREFFLDGIKRDRWCWSGDAYQSYKANNYLYFDPEITRRTIIALLGKPPYFQHVNTINDYSMYLIIGAWEYYYSTGDAHFIQVYYPRIKSLYDFICSRLDDKGYMCKRDGDWIFIDWSEMDKDGDICAEQILLWQTHLCMGRLSKVCGNTGEGYQKKAESLKRAIMRDFWREDKGAFIDCFESGKNHVTRHANIFAILYDFVSPKRARKIMKNVLENDSVTHITTPYFEFFELCAFAKLGKLRYVQNKIESYWGGMLSLGATSIWEQYLPEQNGIEHYGMYGMKYGCSLCHAWGGGPIYLLGRYCLGVYPTDVGYKSFEVCPSLGMYKSIDGRVPLPDGGSVYIKMDKNQCDVTADKPGGVLKIGSCEYPIPVGETVSVKF